MASASVIANIPLRDRLLPMVAEVMSQVHWRDLQLISWDVVVIPSNNMLVTGIVIAVRGVDLTGPMKELARFEALDTWNPDQNKINRTVFTIVEALREFRQSQMR